MYVWHVIRHHWVRAENNGIGPRSEVAKLFPMFFTTMEPNRNRNHLGPKFWFRVIPFKRGYPKDDKMYKTFILRICLPSKLCFAAGTLNYSSLGAHTAAKEYDGLDLICLLLWKGGGFEKDLRILSEDEMCKVEVHTAGPNWNKSR